ncbi:MAG: hypothetical protein ACKOZU_03175 [Planctomycetaceae bacterium]
MVPRRGETWDEAAETRDVMIRHLAHSPANASAAWSSVGVGLIAALAIGAAIAGWLLLGRTRADLRPASIVRDHRRGRE